MRIQRFDLADFLAADFLGVGSGFFLLAVGTPVVSTDSSAAVRELIPGPTAGTVVVVGDQEALVAALDHWLAPGRARPTPIPEPGLEAGTAYLALFDRLVAARLRA